MIYIDRFGNKTMYYRNKQDCGFKEPDLRNKEEIILTQDLELLGKYQSKGFQTYLLSTYFGLAETLGLCEIFSYFCDGVVADDFEMLQVLFDGLIVDSGFVFCLNIDATFCWFRVLNDRLEIWSKEKWDSFIDTASENLSDLADHLFETNFEG